MVVEDGTGLSTANAYASVAEVSTYFTARGITEWDDVTDQEGAIVRATQAIDARARMRFVGDKSTSAQALCWPRINAIDDDGFDIESDIVPIPVKHATAIGALIEGVTTGALQADQLRGGQVKLERVEGAVTVEYFAGAPAGTVYTSYLDALSPVLRNGGASGNIAVVRV